MGLSSSSAPGWAVVALNASAIPLARTIAQALPGAAAVHVRVPDTPARDGVPEGADVRYTQVSTHLQGLFTSGCGIVAIASTGIVVRALAPVIRDKQAEPAVLAVSHDGASVVPVLGGHAARANATAVALAAALGGTAAVTTASETDFGLALDCPPSGLTLANPEHHKAFALALRDRAIVASRCTPECAGDNAWLHASTLSFADASETAGLTLMTTVANERGSEQRLVYHPRRLAVGVGCARNTSPDEVQALILDTLQRANLSADAVAGLFSIHHKLDEDALHEVAARLGVPCRFFSAQRLEQERERLENPSSRVFEEVGCHGVAEGAALAAAGNDGKLLVPKVKTANATCAIALAPCILEATTQGQPRGQLHVVGVGPGAPAYRTPAASAAIAQADDVIGYGLYLDLVADLLSTQQQHRYPLGQERERVRDAIALAATGRRVALVCSGDAGIYAMASLVCELLDASDDPSWGRVATEVVPGVSAMQLASARAGALLGHDFCAISLSDLLTPREVIEQRLQAANAGDFVIALYNPISRQRVRTFERALEILRAGRAPDTVVLVARELGRSDESLLHTTLGKLDAGDLDMLSIVLIGSSNSRSGHSGHRPLAYTPRGYRAPATIQPFAKSSS